MDRANCTKKDFLRGDFSFLCFNFLRFVCFLSFSLNQLMSRPQKINLNRMNKNIFTTLTLTDGSVLSVKEWEIIKSVFKLFRRRK